MPDPTPGEGGGDPRLVALDGTPFEFVGVPGEIYDLLKAHNLTIRCTVAPIPGTDGKSGQVIDRLLIDVPGGVSLVVTPEFAVLYTPDHEVHVKQDRGHRTHEGEVFPDPLFGDDKPHLDYGLKHKIPLDPAWTHGLLVDGYRRPESDFRAGIKWADG